MNTLIKNGTLVTENRAWNADILIRGEHIEAAKDEFEEGEIPEGTEVIDASGKYVFPGFIDAHTHFQLVSRGTVTADRFFDGSILAAFGGVTTVIDFADHLPGKRIAEGTLCRNREASTEMAVDWALHQVVTDVGDDIEAELLELKRSGVSVIKIFTTYKNAGYFIEREKVEKLFAVCRDLGILVTIHAEDDAIIEAKEKELTGNGYPPRLLPLVRPAEAEYRAIKEYGMIAGSLDMPLYIVHLSSKRGLDAVRELRASGIRIYTETTPTYLHLTDDLLSGEMPQRFVMTPPLRKKPDNNALWEGLEKGDIQLVATDHCTFTLEQKLLSNDCRTIYPGVPGTEELLQLIYTNGVAGGKFSVTKLVELLSAAPARIFGLYPEKGSLEPGTDADIVIFDPGAEGVITNENRHTKAGYTPYNGITVKGRVEMTMLRGKVIVKEDTFTGERGSGKFLREQVSGVLL